MRLESPGRGLAGVTTIPRVRSPCSVRAREDQTRSDQHRAATTSTRSSRIDNAGGEECRRTTGRRASQILSRSRTHRRPATARRRDRLRVAGADRGREGTGSVGGRHVEAAVDEMMRAVMPTPRRTGTSKLAHSSGVVGTPRLTWPTISSRTWDRSPRAPHPRTFHSIWLLRPRRRGRTSEGARVSAGTKSLRRKQLDS